MKWFFGLFRTKYETDLRALIEKVSSGGDGLCSVNVRGGISGKLYRITENDVELVGLSNFCVKLHRSTDPVEYMLSMALYIKHDEAHFLENAAVKSAPDRIRLAMFEHIQRITGDRHHY